MKKLFVIAIGLSSIALSAQIDKPKGFENSSRNVVSGTDIRLISASKLSIEPLVPQTESPKITLQFKTTEFPWETKKSIQKVEPDMVKESGKDSIYLSNYLRLGGGNNTHLLGELYLANRPNNLWSYNLHANHFQGKTTKFNREVATTKVAMNGARYFSNSSLSTGLFFNRDFHSFFNQDSGLSESSSQLGLPARDGKSTLNYGVNIDYMTLAKRNFPEIKWLNSVQQFSTNLNHNELEVNTLAKFLSKAKKFSIYGDVGLTYIQFKQRYNQSEKDSVNQQLFVDFKPRVQFYHKATLLDVRIGVNVTLNNNSMGIKSQTYVTPYVAVEKGIKGLEMKIYGQIDGGLQKNSIRRIHEKMPFFNGAIPIENGFEQINGFIGLKGKIASNSLFYMHFGGNTIANLPMFVSATDTVKHFGDSLRSLNVVNNDVSTVFFKTGAEYLVGNMFKINGDIQILNYNSDNIVGHLPSMTYHVSAEYKPIKELVFKVGLNGMGRRYNQIVMNNSLKKVEVKGYTDMYARIDYRFMGKGRLWLQGSNLLNQKYQNWYGYNAFGITVMGGLSIGIL